MGCIDTFMYVFVSGLLGYYFLCVKILNKHDNTFFFYIYKL